MRRRWAATEALPLGWGGIGNTTGSEQVFDGIAVLEIGDVFDAMSTDVLIIHGCEDVVGLAVRHVDLEQSDRPVDGPVEFQTDCRIVGCAGLISISLSS